MKATQTTENENRTEDTEKDFIKTLVNYQKKLSHGYRGL